MRGVFEFSLPAPVVSKEIQGQWPRTVIDKSLCFQVCLVRNNRQYWPEQLLLNHLAVKRYLRQQYRWHLTCSGIQSGGLIAPVQPCTFGLGLL